MSTPISNSTYGITSEWSNRSEQFLSVSLTWKLGINRIDALKIRIANWKPKRNRTNQAIYYYDVLTKEEAYLIIEKFSNFDFLGLENRFDELYDVNNIKMMNTGGVRLWLHDIVPQLKTEFPI